MHGSSDSLQMPKNVFFKVFLSLWAEPTHPKLFVPWCFMNLPPQTGTFPISPILYEAVQGEYLLWQCNIKDYTVWDQQKKWPLASTKKGSGDLKTDVWLRIQVQGTSGLAFGCFQEWSGTHQHHRVTNHQTIYRCMLFYSRRAFFDPTFDSGLLLCSLKSTVFIVLIFRQSPFLIFFSLPLPEVKLTAKQKRSKDDDQNVLQSAESQLKVKPELAETVCHYSGLRHDHHDDGHII